MLQNNLLQKNRLTTFTRGKSLYLKYVEKMNVFIIGTDQCMRSFTVSSLQALLKTFPLEFSSAWNDFRRSFFISELKYERADNQYGAQRGASAVQIKRKAGGKRKVEIATTA